MATAKKTTVNLTAQIQSADCTIDDIISGGTFVGAPKTARVSVNNAPVYNPPNADGTPNEEAKPYSITYSWFEDK